ncbi:pimeloyl-ACP methyl ester carboxylesterase [Dyadobacter sp. BE34]|uniref:Pimeloyl-ACP methyl ester carboxylesterase n=1 Tax=Dyadobacter fermentans TaxID=94254 RepID=A0ABU1QXU8_9BACT|nr:MULTISPECIES: alpha/beta hydrolase [Dyadobacter]MDR6805972.1 pimeloyl-ACP methyl ester carboxylesterase [Dyadobacter fermentans]MDR7043712.1 pimeloyl-ACP methyl ester carboxylesterase [Dyadobacter sp. BE242]MDR7198024.1 pimeloyl-ACP methyl ester carboxylesterase [Dyadobacter sp. BE34]MDR7215986.1 pimeloyl-ACP methyl ester carboxylesterase [Dyadobacter sp. BE31]MDR7264488.1 pimeloyl-ACP methyl ester carboxylesterase [Dyadobacter sp. BE32]
MKRTILCLGLVSLLTGCGGSDTQSPDRNQDLAAGKDTAGFQSGHLPVNGIKMYYQIHGSGKPIVLIHGGGSTIETTFGRVIPLLARHRKVIAVDLQAHGRTSDRNKEESFEQDADDVAALLGKLNIGRADFFGFSNGGTTTLQIAIRHPEIVGKIVLGSALAKRSGVPVEFWDFMKQANLANMPQELKDAYLSVTPDTAGLQTMQDKDARRVLNFKDIPDVQLGSIHAPALIVIADKDVIRPEHALQMQRQIQRAQLAIVPGVHGEYIGEITTVGKGSDQVNFVIPMIEQFLDNAN